MPLITHILFAARETLAMMSPYLLLGFLISGVLSVMLPVRWVKRHLAKPGKTSVLKGALLGVPLPLCSCGVLPVAAWIRRHGASKGAVGSFLLATPQTSADEFLVAFSLLGLGMALYMPFAALVSGILLGLVINLFPDSGRRTDPDEGDDTALPSIPVRIFRHGFVTLAGDIAVPLAVGVLISGVLSAFFDPGQFADFGGGFTAKLLVVVVALPMYVCNMSSLPVAASMLVAGLSPGTVFVFLMAGPATNAATFTTVANLIGKREAVAYVASALVLAVSMGSLLDVVQPMLPPIEAVCLHGESVPLWRDLSSIVLAGILFNGKFRRMRGQGPPR